MLVGPCGSGKTKDYEILAQALTDMAAAGMHDTSGNPFTPVKASVLNPKSITMGQLYVLITSLTNPFFATLMYNCILFCTE